MNQQDEGRLEPEDIRCGGISEFQRQVEEALEGTDEEAIFMVDDGNDEDTEHPDDVSDDDLSAINVDGEFVPDVPTYGSDPFNTPIDPFDNDSFEQEEVEEEAPAPTSATKDTNPKDGVGSAKPSYGNVPTQVLYEIGAAMSEGARKYGAFNYRIAGVRSSVYTDAARRHIDDYLEGTDIDKDSGLHHITKAIASLTVLRDAQMNGMVNDDRPPVPTNDWMDIAQTVASKVVRKYPDPVPPFTQEQVRHKTQTPVEIVHGNVIGFEIEVMLPAEDLPDGFTWVQQGSRRDDFDQSLAVAQALREDGYSERVVRVMAVTDRLEIMENGDAYVNGEMRSVAVALFPGDEVVNEE